MIVYISVCLAMAYIVQSQNSLQMLLSSPAFAIIGLIGALLAIVCTIMKKFPERICYEIFFCCSLLTWYPYWLPYFKEQSPIFFFFPLFFAGITVFLSLVFINNKHKIDAENLDHLRRLSDQPGLQPWALMLCVLGSLELQDHFQVYPVMTTLLLLRFTLSSCIDSNRHLLI